MVKEKIRKLIDQVIPGPLPAYEIERPKVEAHGELSTNLALLLGKERRKAPMAVAAEIAGILKREGDFFEKVEVAGGFVNMTLKKSYWQESLKEIERQGEDYGRSKGGTGQKVIVEFISANPTGPVHIGNARGGPLGDLIASLLEATGFQVTREYYVNDVGGQIDALGRSIRHKLYPQQTSPEEVGYLGGYIDELAERSRLKIGMPFSYKTPEEFERLISILGDFGMEEMMTENRRTCEEMGIFFGNNFVKESDILKEKTAKTITDLKKRKVVQEKEGAVWLATQDEFLQDRECVLVRSDGRPTYFANDIAYHVGKYERGYDRIINIWGSNHHGHVPRMKAALQALGYDPGKLETVLYQYVRVKRGNEAVKMSKRGGNFVTAREVLEEVGKDAFRFFLLTRAPESHLDFDLELAKKQSHDNPVYYVQYAHARIASIFRKWEEQEKNPLGLEKADLSRLNLPEEIHLIRLLHEYPDEVALAARRLEPHRIPFYLLELTRLFQAYYTKAREDPRYRVIGSDIDTTRAKLYLCANLKRTIAGALKLIGVSAPEAMSPGTMPPGAVQETHE